MPRAGLNTERVVGAAAELADEVGLEQLTLAALADRLGVRLPSLYKHIAGLPALRRALAVRAKYELAAMLTDSTAGTARDDALKALTDAYTDWARRHPGRYDASITAPAPDDEEDVAASRAATEAVFEALRGYGLDEDGMVDAVRTLRAVLHGYMALERSGGFGLPRPVDASLDWALGALDAAMRS